MVPSILTAKYVLVVYIITIVIYNEAAIYVYSLTP